MFSLNTRRMRNYFAGIEPIREDARLLRIDLGPAMTPRDCEPDISSAVRGASKRKRG